MMKQDADAQMIGFYILRGHTLDEMMSLSTTDRLFYLAAMEIYNEEMQEIWEGGSDGKKR